MTNNIHIKITEIINDTINCEDSWVVATILFQLYKDKYTIKDFFTEEWINKINNNINKKQVKLDLINDTKNLKNILVTYINNFPEKSGFINRLINKLTFENFINQVIRESRELFYNN